ncbi:MAPK regulated corepressor interacting protein 2 isoform X1 [Camponotus floridanus]|uniref:MAPK regulated corepressor interacting protein 2 isoform X1 n=1 Tax=Camponotus floridanus TaxID=104421 RepID=UPI00059E5273|nr:MAPK regulated corepressor interacting protein 2 isoform X1 [Camponotus floridanus]
MYTVSKGPSKIVAKTRRGISQKLERLETLRDMTRKADPEDPDHEVTRNVPKPVFHINGKSKLISQRHQMQEDISPQHKELVLFIRQSWNQVSTLQRCECCNGTECTEFCNPNSIVYYNDGEPNNSLQDFKPFDLESWWGKRLFNNITKSL